MLYLLPEHDKDGEKDDAKYDYLYLDMNEEEFTEDSTDAEMEDPTDFIPEKKKIKKKISKRNYSNTYYKSPNSYFAPFGSTSTNTKTNKIDSWSFEPNDHNGFEPNDNDWSLQNIRCEL